VKPLKSTPRGMTLIEVLVSLLLFSLAILGLVGMQARATAISLDAEDRSRASMLANDLIATMLIKGTATLTDDELNAWEKRVTNRADGGLSVPEDAAPTVMTDETSGVTTITIKWKAPYKASTDVPNQYVTSVSIQ
jgi:type IV pilus assembly protein PilV